MSTPYSASIIVSAAGVTISPGGLPGPTGPPGPAGAGLTPTAVKTSAYAAAPSDFVPVDTTSGAVTITLPAAPADQTVIGVKMVKQGGTNAVTVAAGGSDRFNITGGASSLSLALLFQGTEVQYDHAAALWYVIADDLSLGSLDGRYT